MDAPAAPTVTIESPAPCSDAARARELLQKTLGPALAPRPSWTVNARFSRKGGSLVVEGEILDEVDSPVAHRALTEASTECSSLARAIGVWAALVLDAEVERAAEASPPPPNPNPPPAPWPAAAPPEKTPAKEESVVLDGSEPAHAFELGVTASLMDGEGVGVMAGPTLYGIVEAGKGWYLRPSIFLARSLQELTTAGSPTDVYGTLTATRFDVCGRISGFHIKRIMLEACGGAELGFMVFDTQDLPEGAMQSNTNSTLPFFALGPSLSLRGELGGGLALVLRGAGDLNVVRESFSNSAIKLNVTPSLFIGRAELGISWELR